MCIHGWIGIARNNNNQLKSSNVTPYIPINFLSNRFLFLITHHTFCPLLVVERNKIENILGLCNQRCLLKRKIAGVRFTI